MLLVAVAAVALASAGFWFGVLSPKRQEAATLDTQIAAKQGELQQSQQQMATYEKARAAYKANYAKLVSLGTAVPGDDDVRSLMVQLDAASGSSNVEFQKVNVGGGSGSAASSTPATGATTMSGVGPDGALASAPGLLPLGSTGVSALPFSFTFDGTFQNLSDFFGRMERFVDVRNEQVSVKGRLLRVESFGIVASGSGWPRMAATVGAASYVVTPVASPTQAKSGGTSGGSKPASGGTTSPSTTTATVTGVAR
jgi:hypothetical protein